MLKSPSESNDDNIKHSLAFQPPKNLRAALKCDEEFNFADLADKHYRNEDLMTGLESIANILVLTKLTSVLVIFLVDRFSCN